jgi:hypothetical protein
MKSALLLMAASVLGSDRPASAVAAAPQPTRRDAGASIVTDVPVIQIASFDCFKAGEGRGDDQGAPIGAWQGGGPGGANWNVTDLDCAAAIVTTCRQGGVVSELRIGRALVARQTTALDAAGRAEWRFKVKRAQWARNLDDEHAVKGALYRTAIFRLTSALTCHKPYELAPGIGSRAELAADRSFLAGFASGE